jgi:maltooligosyltrehalose trehalohydrolase
MHVEATYHNNSCEFTVWAPNHKSVQLTLENAKRTIPLKKIEKGYWTSTVEGVKPSETYRYQLDSQTPKPDPASHFQPNGVFGPSMVVDHEAFNWTDTDWRGLELKDLIFYELHVGTFTPEGTFKAMLERIKELADFGINSIELMPVSQFSGQRGWGYDGVFPFAVHNSYGTPENLKMLVNECHRQGLAVFVDTVYNHIGPEGNCLNDYAPYFVSSRMTTWGPTLNLDEALSGGVRNYFLENTLHWFRDYHLDGLRLDSILWMHDSSPRHFLQELNQTVQAHAEETSRRLYMIAETGFNEPQVLTPAEQGGWGFNGQWLDDFQHSLFSQLTGESKSYYRNFTELEHFTATLTDSYVYVGKDQAFRRPRPKESYRWIPAWQLVVFCQNHDQVGNRLLGDRLTTLAGLEAAKVAAGLVLLSPYVPLLFMGEEYGETAPFMFFSNYSGKELADAIREGRRKEFAEFNWQGEVPDPQSIESFNKSKIDWQRRYTDEGKKIAAYYKALIQLRKKVPTFQATEKRNLKSIQNQQGKVLFIEKSRGESKAALLANLGKEKQRFEFQTGESYVKVLDSTDALWGGKGADLPAKFEPSGVMPGSCLAVYLEAEVSA